MYLRKMSPRTTCLYSAASMLLRSLSAASQSLASKPMVAEEVLSAETDFERAMREIRKAADYGNYAALIPEFEEKMRLEPGELFQEARMDSASVTLSEDLKQRNPFWIPLQRSC